MGNAESLSQYLLVSHDDPIKSDISIDDIQRIYIWFLVQLREEYLVPKKIISVIWSSIVSLLEGLLMIFQKRSNPSWFHRVTADSEPSPFHLIQYEVLADPIQGICLIIESTTRSQYVFINLRKSFVNYQPPGEAVSPSPDDVSESGCFVPITATLSALSSLGDILSCISVNINDYRYAVRRDDDPMLSLRDVNFGARLDGESLLRHPCVDDIGLNKAIGPRKDSHNPLFTPNQEGLLFVQWCESFLNLFQFMSRFASSIVLIPSSLQVRQVPSFFDDVNHFYFSFSFSWYLSSLRDKQVDLLFDGFNPVFSASQASSFFVWRFKWFLSSLVQTSRLWEQISWSVFWSSQLCLPSETGKSFLSAMIPMTYLCLVVHASRLSNTVELIFCSIVSTLLLLQQSKSNHRATNRMSFLCLSVQTDLLFDHLNPVFTWSQTSAFFL